MQLDTEIEAYHAAQAPAMPAPEYVEYPVDPELQPGESAALGGAMELRSPWVRE